MKDFKNITLALIIALASAGFTVWIYSSSISKEKIAQVDNSPNIKPERTPPTELGSNIDLTYAAENSVHSVVHVKVTSEETVRGYSNPFYEWFYGNRGSEQQSRVREGSGSGVIISSDGYIVTNNHVIDGANTIKVVLQDKREFDAKLIGTDLTTDIALLKIEAKDLENLEFGSSDALHLGQWVLAVGNPFNLTSTVTAGIVSAKGRNININPSSMSIESFIQTDAAVNPGNSGGALVNAQGELVGINTAIASQTGSYTGYSFAVPSSIVKKVIDDLKEYGQVQRALLGIRIQNVDAELASQHNIDKIEGVYVASVSPHSAAYKAGMETDDVITSIAGTRVNSVAELQEAVSKHRPGDTVKILAKRNGEEKEFEVTFENIHGNTQLISSDELFLGAKYKELKPSELRDFRIHTGIQIVELSRGKLKAAGVKEDFIITRANKQAVSSISDLESIISQANGGVLIEGLYPNGEAAYYVFSTTD